MRKPTVATLFLCFLVVVIAGCGGSDTNLPELVPVGGTVTIDGKPLADTQVIFCPVGSTRGTGATGYTDRSGRYKLSARHGAGAAVGRYRVVMSKLVMPDGSPYRAKDGVPPMESPAGEVLPVKYVAPDQTLLEATVPAGGTDQADFDLTSK